MSLWPFDAMGQSLLDNALSGIQGHVSKALTQSLVSLGTAWLRSNDLVLTPGSAADTAIGDAHSILHPAVVALMVMSVLVAGGRMAWQRRADPGRDLMFSLVTASVVSAGGVAVLSQLIDAMDALATALIPAQDANTFATKFSAFFATTPDSASAGLLLYSALYLVAVIVSLVQIVLLLFRSTALILLLAVLPIAGAFTNLESGRRWFGKCLSWTLAFLLYKPVGALIYNVAFKLLAVDGTKDGATYTALCGITMLSFGILALPALMKFCTPMVAAAAGGIGVGASAGAPPSGSSPSGSSPSGAVPTGSAAPGKASAPAAGPTADSTAGSGVAAAGSSPTGSGSATGRGSTGAKGASPAAALNGGGALGATSSASAPSAGASGGAAAGGGAAASGAAAGGNAAASAASAGAGAATGGVGLAVQKGVEVGVWAAKASHAAANNAAAGATGEGPSGSS